MENYNTQEENELLAALAKGDKTAFNQFYKLFEQRIYRIAYGYFNNREEAEEATQDVFVKVVRAAGGFGGKAAAATWVYRITVNICLDKLRFKKVRQSFSFITSFFNDEHETIESTIADPDNHGIAADKAEDTSILLAAIGKLPTQQGTALLLTQIEELSGKETAAIMNVTPKAVEGLVQRGKANLKKILENYYDKQGK